MFLVADVAGGMKDSEPMLLGSPDLPDISLSSGCQDHQIYVSLWRIEEARGSLVCLTSCLSLAMLRCCSGNKSKCSIFELNSKCHSCPFSHLDQTPCSDSHGVEVHSGKAFVKSHKWSISSRPSPICTVKWVVNSDALSAEVKRLPPQEIFSDLFWWRKCRTVLMCH